MNFSTASGDIDLGLQAAFHRLRPWLCFLSLFAGSTLRAQEFPTIVDIPNQAMFRNSTKLIPVVVGTNPVVAETWTVSAASSDTTIVPNEAANLFVSGSGTNRIITVRPTLDRVGKTTITVQALDSLGRRTNDVFVLEVRVTNAPPVIERLEDVDVVSGIGRTIAFTVRDDETVWDQLTLSATTDTVSVMSASEVSFSGSGGNRIVTLKPSANIEGITSVTLTVQDTDGGKASTTFIAFVTRSNISPEIVAVPDQFTRAGTPFKDIKFNIADHETPFVNLVVTAQTSNPGVVPLENITLAGTGFERQVSIFPGDGPGGVAWITLTVRDRAGATASTTFRAVVEGASLVTTIAAGQLKLSWDDLNHLSLRYTLDFSRGIATPTVWEAVPQTPAIVNNRVEVTLPIDPQASARLFRLRRIF